MSSGNTEMMFCMGVHQLHNKAFKSDSQRLAFLVLLVGFCVYSAMV